MDLVQLRNKKDDPLVRNAEKDIEDQGASPMSPPDPYAPPGKGQGVPYEQMHPLLQALRDDHAQHLAQLDAFEGALTSLPEQGITQEIDETLRSFFRSLDEELFPHMKREEKKLFPLLERRLLDKGEHSKGAEPTTAVDLLETEHMQILQLSALVLNFFALASRLPDPTSRALVFDAAIEEGKALVELLRLHAFREDHIVFSLAHAHITAEELDALQG